MYGARTARNRLSRSPRGHARSQEPDRLAFLRPAGRNAPRTRRGGFGLHGARRRKDASAESGDGEHCRMGPDQQLQTDRAAIQRLEGGVSAGRDGRHRQADRGGDGRPRNHLQAGLSLQEGRRHFSRSGGGRPRARRPVRSSGRCALDPPHARGRRAQRAFRPRGCRFRHGRRTPRLGTAAGIYRRVTRRCWTNCCGYRGGQGTTTCGRFTQNYTWEEVYAFLNVFGAPRNCARATTLPRRRMST
jgi:hypothetical protein